MTQTIEQLTARVRELEEENARLKAECDDIKQVQFPRKLESVAVGWKKQLAASQAYAEQLREAIFQFRNEPILGRAPSVRRTSGYAAMEHAVFDLPRDTSALDAFVAEKVKEYGDEARRQMQHATKAVWQRDLAVEACRKLSEIRYIEESAVGPLREALAAVKKALSTIKES